VADLVVSTADRVNRQAIQRHPQPREGEVSDAHLEDRINATKGGGSAMPQEVRSFFEPRMQSDFGGVRIHTDHEAAQLNRALDARAFATGRDIYFGANEYRPDTADGRRLLAHELTHVVQQGWAHQDGAPRRLKR